MWRKAEAKMAKANGKERKARGVKAARRAGRDPPSHSDCHDPRGARTAVVFTLRLHPSPGRCHPRVALRPAAVCTLRRPAATTTSFDAPRLALATLWSRRLDHGTQKEMRVIIVIVDV